MLKYLNDITEEDLIEIKKLASLFFSPIEIAEMLEIDELSFISACKIQSSKIYPYYRGGFYEGQIDLRTGIMKMAKAGSTPAQTMGLELVKKLTLKL